MIKEELNRILDFSAPYKACTMELLMKIQSGLEYLFHLYDLTGISYKLSFGKTEGNRSVTIKPLNAISYWALKGMGLYDKTN